VELKAPISTNFVRVNNGHDFLFNCKSDSPPIWFFRKNKSEIYTYDLGSNEKGSSSIRLVHLGHDDEGFYCCVGFSNATQTHFISEAKLLVYGEFSGPNTVRILRHGYVQLLVVAYSKGESSLC